MHRRQPAENSTSIAPNFAELSPAGARPETRTLGRELLRTCTGTSRASCLTASFLETPRRCCARHLVSRLGCNPWHRATSCSTAPDRCASCTICAFSVADHFRRLRVTDSRTDPTPPSALTPSICAPPVHRCSVPATTGPSSHSRGSLIHGPRPHAYANRASGISAGTTPQLDRQIVFRLAQQTAKRRATRSTSTPADTTGPPRVPTPNSPP